MTRTKSTYLAVVAVVLSPMVANADPITITYDFSMDFGGAIVPDPATGSLTVTFDPDGGDVFGATTATLDSANFAVDGALVFNFFTATDSIQVGGVLNGLGGVFNNTNDFLLSLDFIASATPILPAGLSFLAQTGFNQATNVSGSVSVASADPDTDNDGVPDDDDICPDTPAGDAVDANGCSDAQLDTDNDGVSDADDNCPGTVIPESVPTRSLGVNRFALVDGDDVFDTTSPKGKGPRRGYTIANTTGCSCTQIIDALGLGNGHTKFGCSISAMDDWVLLVNP